MPNQSNIRNYSWWIFGLIGLVIGLSKADGKINGFGIMALLGITNGIFWGWLLGYIIDKLNFPIKNNSQKELEETIEKISNKIFPYGQKQVDKEINDIRLLLDFKYTKEDIRQTYLHASSIFYISTDSDFVLTSILKHEKSVVTKDDAKLIINYLQKKFNRTLSTKSNESLLETDSSRMYIIAKGGIVELKNTYHKDLTERGKLEIAIFNLAYILILDKKYSSAFERTKKEFFEIIIKQTQDLGVNADKNVLSTFIASRIKTYQNEIINLTITQNYLPLRLYSNFYIRPLSNNPETNIKSVEIILFKKGLKTMMNWIKINSYKITDKAI